MFACNDISEEKGDTRRKRSIVDISKWWQEKNDSYNTVNIIDG